MAGILRVLGVLAGSMAEILRQDYWEYNQYKTPRIRSTRILYKHL